MADTVNVGGVNYSTDDVTTLNGATVAAGSNQTQRMKVQYGDDGTARDVSQAFPLPVNLSASGGNVAIVTGTLSVVAAAPVASTATSTSQIVMDVSTMGNVGVGVSTAAFVGSLTFEVSPIAVPTATDWYTIDLNPLSASYPGGGVVSFNVATQTNRMYEGGLFTPKWAKVRLSALTSGTAAVALGAGPGWVESNPMLTAGNANIGATMPAGPATFTGPTATTLTANTAFTAAAADPARRSLTITNRHATGSVTVTFNATATTSNWSYTIPPNGALEVPPGSMTALASVISTVAAPITTLLGA